MAYIFIIAALICAIQMFRVRLEYKIAILLLSLILFTYTSLPFATIKMSRLILICFILSELKNFNNIIKSIKGSILWKLTGLLLLSIIILIINSPHLKDISTISFLLRDELFLKYFVVIYMFYACKSVDSLKPSLNFSYYGLLILTIFGIINLVMQEPIYISSMTSVSGNTNLFELGNKMIDSERARVQSLFVNPFDYGFICILIMLFHLWGYNKNVVRKNRLWITILCCAFGIVACGSRTVILCGLFGISIYCYFAFSSIRSLKYAVIVILSLTIASQLFSSVNEKIEETISVFDEKSTTEGSNIEGRNIQFAAVFYHIKDNPLFGNGYLYFVRDMGWGKDGKEGLLDKDLYGLEGVMMNYLLERGIVGLIFYYTFYISLAFYIWKHRKSYKDEVALGMSTLGVYLLFANMTGELNSVTPTLLIVGCMVKIIKHDYKNIPQNSNRIKAQECQVI